MDDVGRLTSRRYTPATGTAKTVDYAYDADNHRIASWGDLDVARLPAVVPSSTYDDANRLTARGSTEPTYDAAGNLTDDGQRTLTWNDRNQLTRVTQGSAETDYAYDGIGRRRSTTAGGNTTSFVYDGWNAIQQSVDGGATTDLLTGMSADEVYAITAGGTTQTSLDDALGTSVGTADGAGITASGTSDPFGQGTATGARWAGGVQDSSGLIDRRMRTYDPDLGTFTSEDPSSTAGGVNLYAYGAGDPVDFTDALGLWPSWSDVGHAVAATAIGPAGLLVPWSDVGHAVGAVYDEASSHYGVAAAVVGGAACIALSGGACSFVLVGGGLINSAIILHDSDLTTGQKIGGVGLTAVVTFAGAGPAASLGLAGKAIDEAPGFIKYPANFMAGLGGTVGGLLDPHVSASGGLAGSLDEEG